MDPVVAQPPGMSLLQAGVHRSAICCETQSSFLSEAMAVRLTWLQQLWHSFPRGRIQRGVLLGALILALPPLGDSSHSTIARSQSLPGTSKALLDTAKTMESKQLDPKLVSSLLEYARQQSIIPPNAWAKPLPESVHPVSIQLFELVSDTDSSMEAVVVQAGDGVGALIVGPLLQALRPEIQMVVLVPSRSFATMTWNRLRMAGVKDVERRVRFVLLPTKLSSWGRDPYTVLVDAKDGRYTLLPAIGDSGTQQSRGVTSLFMQRDLRDFHLVPNNTPPTLDLQGGDVRSDSQFVYVGAESMHYSRYNQAAGQLLAPEQVVMKVEQTTKRKLIVLDGPDVHNDRYHAPLGQTPFGTHTSLLSDPILALETIAAMSPDEKERATDKIFEALKGETDENSGKTITREQVRAFFLVTRQQIEQARKSSEVQKLNDVKQTLEDHGITVRRIPGIPEGFAGSPLGFYYTNSLMDRYADANGRPHRSAILPRYNVPALDLMAQQAYADAGFDVIKTIDGVYLGFMKGGPRCFVQVLAQPFHPKTNQLPAPAAPKASSPSPAAARQRASITGKKMESRAWLLANMGVPKPAMTDPEDTGLKGLRFKPTVVDWVQQGWAYLERFARFEAVAAVAAGLLALGFALKTAAARMNSYRRALSQAYRRAA